MKHLYDDLSQKVSKLTTNLKYFPSPPFNFRTRAELGVSLTNDIQFTMVENNKKIMIDNLNICDARINELIKQLKIKYLPVTKNQDNFLSLEI